MDAFHLFNNLHRRQGNYMIRKDLQDKGHLPHPQGHPHPSIRLAVAPAAEAAARARVLAAALAEDLLEDRAEDLAAALAAVPAEIVDNNRDLAANQALPVLETPSI